MSKAQYLIHKQCDICGSKENSIIFRIGAQRLVKCQKCRLVFFDKQRIDLTNLYNQGYYFKSDGSNYSNYEDLDSNDLWKFNFKFAYDFIKKSSKKTLLDIGAGFGYFIKYLPKNIKAEAVEVSAMAADKIRSNKIKVYQGDFLSLNFNKKYDFITSFDMIEHQIHLKKYLNKVRSNLKKNGYFIFTTPDFGSMFNKILGNKAPLIQPNYHNYYFDKTWLAQNLPLFGFKIISIKAIYFGKMSLEQAMFLASFPFPILKRIKLFKKIILLFIRLGGIQVIAQRDWPL